MFIVCKIIVDNKELESNLKGFLRGYPVDISCNSSIDEHLNMPILFVGWDLVKRIFPLQKIHDNKVNENIEWTYNESECNEIDKEGFYSNIEEFVNRNLKSWLPSNFILYDYIIHGELIKFIEANINNEIKTYVHYNNGAIYMRNGDNDYIINTKSLWMFDDDYRNTITNVLNSTNCMVYSYNGIEDYVNLDTLGNLVSLDILRWIKFGVETPIKYFQIIPNIDISKYIPFLMSKIVMNSLELNNQELIYFNRMCQRDKITRWMSSRYLSFSYDFKKNLNFIFRENAKLAKINYSSKRTITGRITSIDKYNPQNLSKTNEDRSMIISRFTGGKVYQFDYTSFEARISLYLSEDEEFIENYYDKDLHLETAMLIFDVFEPTEEQREIAKLVNHSVLYGAGEATILSKLQSLPNPIEKMIIVKEFLAPIFKKSKELMELSEKYGYIINKWGSIIKPEKSYAGFNNYIQSTASEIIVDKVIEIKELLINCRSQFMFQVHDSLVFDIHPEENYLIEKIYKIMSYHRNMIFSVDYKSGSNFKDLHY